MRNFLQTFGLILIMHSAASGQGGGEILWDNYGVPHIYGNTIDRMYYEFGWAQMHNHANLILRLYGQARGRAAEYWGESYLASDKQVHLFGVPDLAATEYASQDTGFRKMLDAFVDGMNAYADKHPEAVDPENRQVLPVKADDIMAHSIRVIFLRFVAGENLGMASRKLQAGSNAIAVGAGRSASKNSLLLANPHLPWGDLFTFFEAALSAPGFFAYGAAIVGLPVLNIAFNHHLGWTLTVNTIDACDRYELEVHDGKYLLDSVLVPFEKRSVTIKVRQADGTLSPQTVGFNYARQGPVLGIQGDKAYAIRIAGFTNPAILYQWHQMAQATHWASFEAALKTMQLPMFNVIYADDRRNIFYLFDGAVPRRSSGDWKFWNGTVDGRYSRYIWDQSLSYGELPALLDPATGFIQNANDPPWNCTYPAVLKPGKFPEYLSPQGMALRPQRAVNMIRNEYRLTLEKLAGIKLNTGMEAAGRLLKELLAAGRMDPDSIVRLACNVLEKWDGTTEAESRGSVLFARWFDKLTPDMYRLPWSPEHPVETPAGLKDPKDAAALLAKAAREITAEYGSLDVPWGTVYRFRLNGADYPANGGPEQYGIYRTIYYAKDKDGKYRAVAGDSYVAITEFGKKVRASVLLSYGNASQRRNPHCGDQLLLLSKKQLRTALLEKEEVLKNLEEREIF